MADSSREPAPDLVRALVDDGRRFDFFQALRLLRLKLGDERFKRDVRVRSELSLAFPNTDLKGVEELPDGVYRITANFFGLYGVSSPLPTFYTEDLIDEARNDYHGVREFLDILHHLLYPKYFQAWERSRLWLAVTERGDQRRLEQLFALIGLADPETRSGVVDAMGILRFTGLFSQFPHSAMGLRTLIRGMLNGAAVELRQCALRHVPVPENARLYLGESNCRVGDDSVLGQSIADRAGSADVVIGPVNAKTLHALLPGGALADKLVSWVSLYRAAPITFRLIVRLRAGQGRSATLGSRRWSRLGEDTWLTHPQLPTELAMHTILA